MSISASSKVLQLTTILATLVGAPSCSSSNFNAATGTQKTASVPDEKKSATPPEELPDIPKTLAPDGAGTDGFFTADAVKTPRFALLVNDLKCGMCHTKVNGDVASTSAVIDWSNGHAPISNEAISGNWYAAKTWTDRTPNGNRYNIKIGGKVEQNYAGNQLPIDDISGKPAFPTIDFGGAELRMSGTLQGLDAAGQAVTISKVHTGDVVITGTKDAPMVIDGSVMIKGDLVIKGVYKGLGTIYVTGTVYIPANLTASDSIFPLPADPVAAKKKGQDLVTSKSGSALGIATSKSILIADLDSGIYDNELTPPTQKRAALGIDDLYTWFPGGKAGYAKLYENAANCDTDKLESPRGFNQIDAYMYAAVSIGGRARRSSWAINGGVITDVFHVLGGVSATGSRTECPSTPSIIHGLPQNGNYVNYDYRMLAGLRILGELSPYFK